MLSKTTSRAGFTIIEVVITIAIGAAVMALVLNAVAGARRSQRNNARVADVGTVTGAINDYIANRNTLPVGWTDIDDSVEDLNQYQALADTFMAGTWDSGKPSTNGNFLIWGATGTEATQSGNPPNSMSAFCSDPSFTNQTACENGPDGFPPGNALDTLDAEAWTPASTGGVWGDDDAQDRHDFMVVIREARCTGTNTGVLYGGLRRVVIIYKLEGQDGVTCRDI